MKVLRSNHQNLLRVSKGLAASACSGDLLPLSVRVFVHRVANRVDLFPAFAPLVRISLLRAHVDNLQLVSPFPRIFLLVLDAVTFNIVVGSNRLLQFVADNHTRAFCCRSSREHHNPSARVRERGLEKIVSYLPIPRRRL